MEHESDEYNKFLPCSNFPTDFSGRRHHRIERQRTNAPIGKHKSRRFKRLRFVAGSSPTSASAVDPNYISGYAVVSE